MSVEGFAFEQMCVERIVHGGRGAIKIGPFGSQLKKEDMHQDGVKVYGQENIILSDWAAGSRRISPSKALGLASCRLETGDVVLTMMGTIGRCSVFPESAEPGIMDSHLLRIQPDTSIVDRHFLSKVIADPRTVGRQVDRLSHGTIMAGLSSKIVRQLRLPVPPLREQRRMAEILDTLDEAIRSTEQVIAKLQQVKQGLLHDLLTRGIDEHGELRDPERHPEQFQDSPLGRIPKAWIVSNVDVEFDITSGITLGAHRRPNHHPHPYLRVANVHRDRLDLSDVAHLEARPRELTGKTLSAGDLLIVEGHANPDEIGRCAMATVEVEGFTFQNHLFRLRPNRLSQAYALLWLNGELTRRYWTRVCSTSSGLYTINRTLLGALRVVVPCAREQEQVIAVADRLNHRLSQESETLLKLRTVKCGLMDDLLTGRVRVPAEATR